MGTIDPSILEKLTAYWRAEDVTCIHAELPDETPLAELWATSGFPEQDWWIFSFEVPSSHDAPFGFADSWRCFYNRADDSVVFKDEQGNEYFANTSIAAFAQMLTLWDAAYRRIQRECPGDSGEEWERGTVIVRAMREAMRAVDPRAFEQESFFWPVLVVEQAWG